MARRLLSLGVVGAAACLALLCLGCTEQSPQAPGTASTSEGPTGKAELPLLDEKELPRVLQQQEGKIVLLDFWATWCEPCKELFPHTVALERQFAEQGLVVVAVSLDEPESQGEVARFLASQQASFANYLSRYGGSPEAAAAFAIPEGGLPHARLYDRQGKLYRSFDMGTFQAADLEQAVRELLARP